MSLEAEQALGISKKRAILVPNFIPANADPKDTTVYSGYPGEAGSVVLAIVPSDLKKHPYRIINGRRVIIKAKRCVRCKNNFWRFSGKHMDSPQCGKCTRTQEKVATYV